MKSILWLLFTFVTASFWGLWEDIIKIPEKAGFHAALGYSIWTLTIISPALVVVKVINRNPELYFRSVFYAVLICFLGAEGQLILFHTLRMRPAYPVFLLISFSSIVAISLLYLFIIKEAGKRGWSETVIVLLLVPLLLNLDHAFSVITGYLWIVFAFLVFLTWCFQAYIMKFADETRKTERIFFFMMISGLILLPFAIRRTDFARPIKYKCKGPYLSAKIKFF